MTLEEGSVYKEGSGQHKAVSERAERRREEAARTNKGGGGAGTLVLCLSLVQSQRKEW